MRNPYSDYNRCFGSASAMATKVSLVCFTTLLLCGFCFCGPAGREFALSYMQNYINEPYEYSDHLIEVFNPPTAKVSAMVKVSALGNIQQKAIEPGKTEMFRFPDEIEIVETSKGKQTVLVEANQDVLVTSINYKYTSSGTTVVYPVKEWGTDYHIFTPTSPAPKNPMPYAYTEFTITNYKTKNSVEVHLRGEVNFQGKQYPKGSKLIIDLDPYESVLLQSKEDLTDTTVSAKEPVAVFTGHSCTWLFAGCDHVYEQLLPVSSWGTDFIVAPISYSNPPKRYDSVFIQASQDSKITLTGQDGTTLPTEIKAGESYRANLFGRSSIHITSDKGIQVLYEFNGGITEEKVMNDPFLMNILPTDRFSKSYTLQGESGFSNKAIIIARTNKLSELILNEAQMPKNLQWYKTGSSEYSWTELTFSNTSALHTVSHPDTPFILYSFGVTCVNGYGTLPFALPPAVVDCPANSHFESSASSCPATCENPNPSSDCAKVEACICNDGYVLSGNNCVPKSQCGCVYSVGSEKYYLKTGESVWADNSCNLKCTCKSNGQMACENTSCLPGEECKLTDGQRGCTPSSYTTCTISGDPHYNTFDNSTYDFQGTCTYTTAQACHLEGTKLIPFTVLVENDRWNEIQNSPNVSVAKVVIVLVQNDTLVLQRNHLKQIWVNGAVTNIPVSLQNGKLMVFQEGTHYAITTDFGLKVTYDMIYHVTITVPSTYQDKMCGLCGNYNGNRTDDYQLPDGKLTTNINTFGAAWDVPIIGAGECGPLIPEDCEPKNMDIANKNCSIITDPKGPFAACHSVISPDSYYNDCVYDLCVTGGDHNILCNSIHSYMIDCQNVAVVIKDWRTPTFCNISCPANSHYETCARVCSTPCPGFTDIITCADTCAEGCACDSGFYFNGTGCVKADQCSCYEDGRTYDIGETVITDDCSERLTCLANGKVNHEKINCNSNEACLVRNGVRGCYVNQCTMNTGGIFNFFSGGKGTITAMGFYEIVRACNGTLEVDWFRVVLDLQACGTGGVTRAIAVYVFFDNLFISVNSKHEIWFNGMKVSTSHLRRADILLTIQNGFVIIEKTGLRVSYSITQEVSVSVSGQLADKVCGACGELAYNISASIFQSEMNNYAAPDFPTC